MTLPLINRARTWVTGQDWNPVRRTRRWYEASEWSRMTSRDRAWHAGGWVGLLVIVVFVGVLYAGAVATWPRAGAFLTFAAIYGGLWASLGYWYGTQAMASLREQLHFAKQLGHAAAAFYATDLLDEGGPITGENPVVEMFDQDSPAAEVPA